MARARASISHSHAIYAAVIEHEAFSAKRKAALALAHDVKFWNYFRKREVLKMCLKTAESQRNAAKQASEAWTLLLEGFFGPTNTDVESYNPPTTTHLDTPPTTFISCPKLIPVDHVALTPVDNASPPFSRSPTDSFPDHLLDQSENEMTASMQSLVDGLMTWGFAQGAYDPQDDMSLPTGMALQLLEESTGVAKT